MSAGVMALTALSSKYGMVLVRTMCSLLSHVLSFRRGFTSSV
jgi:hypothetical protein